MENGKWKMEDGKWKMENGKWLKMFALPGSEERGIFQAKPLPDPLLGKEREIGSSSPRLRGEDRGEVLFMFPAPLIPPHDSASRLHDCHTQA
jgi:hypothetical protein